MLMCLVLFKMCMVFNSKIHFKQSVEEFLFLSCMAIAERKLRREKTVDRVRDEKGR